MSENLRGGVGLVSESLANALSLLLLVDSRAMSWVVTSLFRAMPLERVLSKLAVEDFLVRSHATLAFLAIIPADSFELFLLFVVVLLLFAMVDAQPVFLAILLP